MSTLETLVPVLVNLFWNSGLGDLDPFLRLETRDQGSDLHPVLVGVCFDGKFLVHAYIKTSDVVCALIDLHAGRGEMGASRDISTDVTLICLALG